MFSDETKKGGKACLNLTQVMTFAGRADGCCSCRGRIGCGSWNIWKFPYVAGENGGGAFVLIYLVCVGLVGAPIMMAEIALGREGRSSPITTMTKLAASAGRNSQWSIIGWMGVIAGVMILSFYAVIAGWALQVSGSSHPANLKMLELEVVESTFNGLLASPVEMILWQTVFMVGTIWIVARGVSGDREGHTLVHATIIRHADCTTRI